MAQWRDDNDNPCNDNTKNLHCDNCNGPALGYPFWECNILPSIFCPHCGEKMTNGQEFENKPV